MASLTLARLRPQRLEPIDLRIEAGALVFISGASGAGKSLLLRAIADLDPSDGEALIDDMPRSRLPAPEWRRRVALLPAESGWWADRVGVHFATLDRAAPPAGRERLHQRLAQLGFAPDVLDWDVLRLSTGERQRLALVRLLENEPEVLLLDEATANLDPTNQARAETLIDEYRREKDAAVLWASHDPDQRRRLSETTAGRRLVIEAGRLQPEPPD